MKSLSIVLKIEGEDKRFVSPAFIPGKLFRQASEIASEYEGKTESTDFNLDAKMQFVCDAFGNQFTFDELENGIDSRNVIKTIYATCNYVIGNIEQASMLLSDGEGDSDSKN
jgi:hypothetical protein